MIVNLVTGYDERESIGWSVFCHSVVARSSLPVSITPLASMGTPQGTNAFTASRFLVPYLNGYRGTAIFVDGADMLCLGDIAELWRLADPAYAIQVVQRPDYRTRNPVKYRETSMEAANKDYPRKNWASVFIANCAHPAWKIINPTSVQAMPIGNLLGLGFAEGAIGELPSEWNRLVDEGDGIGKILHWTAGIPAFPAYADAPYADLWHGERLQMERSG